MSSPPAASTSGSWTWNSVPKVAAASRARPMTLRQSGRLFVISNSTTLSVRPRTFLMSSPGSQGSWRIKMPSSMA